MNKTFPPLDVPSLRLASGRIIGGPSLGTVEGAWVEDMTSFIRELKSFISVRKDKLVGVSGCSFSDEDVPH